MFVYVCETDDLELDFWETVNNANDLMFEWGGCAYGDGLFLWCGWTEFRRFFLICDGHDTLMKGCQGNSLLYINDLQSLFRNFNNISNFQEFYANIGKCKN